MPASGTPVSFQAAGAPEVVFSWERQRCDTLHIPDSPARAIRRSDGGIALYAAHFTNVPLLGADFDHLLPACASASRGREADDPAAFDDRFWVQALAPLPDGRVLGLASHEYMGSRHPGRCAGEGGSGCWYSAITALTADQTDWRFRPLPIERRVIASHHSPYSPVGPDRSGFFSITNIVFDGDHAYMLAQTQNVPGQPTGMCLFRAPRRDLEGGWRVLSGGAFRALRGNPYTADTRPGPPCDVVGGGGIRSVRSLVRLGEKGPWLAVMAGRAPDPVTGQETSGAVYSTSADLRTWSKAELLWPMVPFHGQPQAGVYYQYPSLIDHDSPSPVFDTVGDHVWLYMTRFNLMDRRQGMNRDLVRVRLAVVRRPAG